MHCIRGVHESKQSIDCGIVGANTTVVNAKVHESRQSIDCDIAGAKHHCCQRRALNVFMSRGRASTVASQVQSTTVVNAER